MGLAYQHKLLCFQILSVARFDEVDTGAETFQLCVVYFKLARDICAGLG